MSGGPITSPGIVVVINFWATWCTACQDEIPAIEQVWDRYRGRGLDVIAVDFREGNKAAMQRFLGKWGRSSPRLSIRTARSPTRMG